MAQPRMIAVENTLISEEVIDKQFICDIQKCKGGCCVEGDSGAPLEKGEEAILQSIYAKVEPYMQADGIATIKEKGLCVVDEDGDDTIPLVEGGKKKYCSFVVFEKNGIASCAIEKAYHDGKVDFKKPVSCHLYPIRITKLNDIDALNYSSWWVCRPAHYKGKKEGLPLYKFLKEPLVRKYGESWYKKLEETVAHMHSE